MSENKKSAFSEILKGTILALCFMIVAILIFAGIVKLTKISSSGIRAVNQFIKVLSVFFACCYSISGGGIYKGGIIGGLSITVMYLVFALFGFAQFSQTFWALDILFVSVIGLICGIIAVNIKKDR